MNGLPQDTGSASEPSQHPGEERLDLRSGDEENSHAAPDTNDVGSLIRVALIGGSEGAGLDAHVAPNEWGMADPVYDGHVPLALEADFLPAIDATLDLLTTSTDLFDVPVADFGPPVASGEEA